MPKLTNAQVAAKSKQDESTKATLSALKENSNIWYKIHVLIYDLCSVKNDRSSESRIERTVDELYISEPYFTTSEAALVKAALVEITESISNEEVSSAAKELKTIEEAIKERLSNFYNKRKASGDFRPCGPHDMAPVYMSVFGIPRGELENESFLSRLRRSGLDDSREQHKEAGKTDKKKKYKKGR